MTPSLSCLATRTGMRPAHRPHRPRRRALHAWLTRLIFFLITLAMMLAPLLGAAGAIGG